MIMSEELIIGSEGAVDVFGGGDGEGSVILPRLEICYGNSGAVRDGIAIPGDLAVNDSGDCEKVGREMKVQLLEVRAKAIDFGADDIVISHNPASDAFRHIAENAADDDEKAFGPEFLLYSEKYGYLTFFCKSNTTRKTAKKQLSKIGSLVDIKVKTIEGKRNTWYDFRMKTDTDNAIVLPSDVASVISEFKSNSGLNC